MVASAREGGNLLQSYHNYWHVYRNGVDYLNKLYMYLNTQHIKVRWQMHFRTKVTGAQLPTQKQKCTEADMSYGCIELSDQKLEIGELGLHLWRKNMIEPLQEQLVKLLLEAIEE